MLLKAVSKVNGNHLHPRSPFTYSWLNEDLDKSNSQAATVSLLGYLAFIAVAIATLGLLGLVVYSIEVKQKEVSIRKIIGASEKQLVKMLSGRFIKLIVYCRNYCNAYRLYCGLFVPAKFCLTCQFRVVQCASVFCLIIGDRFIYNHIANIQGGDG